MNWCIPRLFNQSSIVTGHLQYLVPVLMSNGKMKICVDFKSLNSKINIEKYLVPKLDEILTTIGDNKYFCKIDLARVYLQLSVAEESKKCLVISTQKGLFSFIRLPFRLAFAPGIFQKFISQLLADIKQRWADTKISTDTNT